MDILLRLGLLIENLLLAEMALLNVIGLFLTFWISLISSVTVFIILLF